MHGDIGDINKWGYLHRHWCYLHRHRRYVYRHAAMAREVTSKGEVTYITILHRDRGNIKKWGYLHRHWCYLHRQAPMAREVISKYEVTYIAMLPGDRGNIRPYLCRQGATKDMIPPPYLTLSYRLIFFDIDILKRNHSEKWVRDKEDGKGEKY